MAARGTTASPAGHAVTGSCLGDWAISLACSKAPNQRASGTKSESRISPMGLNGSIDLDETMEDRARRRGSEPLDPKRRSPRRGWIVVLVASLVFLVNIVSPPRLIDDVDAVQAQIARNMLASGDWVTARL